MRHFLGSLLLPVRAIPSRDSDERRRHVGPTTREPNALRTLAREISLAPPPRACAPLREIPLSPPCGRAVILAVRACSVVASNPRRPLPDPSTIPSRDDHALRQPLLLSGGSFSPRRAPSPLAAAPPFAMNATCGSHDDFTTRCPPPAPLLFHGTDQLSPPHRSPPNPSSRLMFCMILYDSRVLFCSLIAPFLLVPYTGFAATRSRPAELLYGRRPSGWGWRASSCHIS